MAAYHERQGRRYSDWGYAPVGHPRPKPRPDRDVYRRPRFVNYLLYGANGAGEHPPAAGGWDRGGKGAGRHLRPGQDAAPAQLCGGAYRLRGRAALLASGCETDGHEQEHLFPAVPADAGGRNLQKPVPHAVQPGMGMI